jgi:hypothetical protein
MKDPLLRFLMISAVSGMLRIVVCMKVPICLGSTLFELTHTVIVDVFEFASLQRMKLVEVSW